MNILALNDTTMVKCQNGHSHSTMQIYMSGARDPADPTATKFACPKCDKALDIYIEFGNGVIFPPVANHILSRKSNGKLEAKPILPFLS